MSRLIFRVLPKYAALFAVFSILSNPVTTWNSVQEWWTALTALTLGNWVRVTTCDSCRHAISNSAERTALCPRCGGESFTERKAQQLLDLRGEADWSTPLVFFGDRRASVSGHAFPDGTVTTVPGHWIVPEREVR